MRFFESLQEGIINLTEQGYDLSPVLFPTEPPYKYWCRLLWKLDDEYQGVPP